MNRTEVEQRMRVRQLMPDGTEKEYLAAARYSRSAPFEVAITFFPKDQGPVEWVFEREMFIKGCFALLPIGDGDIRIHCCRPGVQLHIDIFSLDEKHGALYATVHLPFEEVSKFLTASFQVVPHGGERLPENEIDAVIELILDEEE